MLISHRHRFLYFVVPKCGSATLRKSLAPHADIGWPVTEYTQHLTVPRFLATEHAGLLDAYFRFTFVRNPYDRLYSGYLQDRFAAVNYPRWTAAKKPIFDAIGDDFNTYFNDYAVPGDIRADWTWICFCPMQEFTHLHGECVIDFVGKAERLEADLQRLSSRLGIPIEKAPDANVRPASPIGTLKYLDRYTRRTIENVNRIYARDFELFDYEMLDPTDFPQRLDAPPGADGGASK